MSRLQITSPNELSIEFAPGTRFAIHPLWLRERCQDAKTIDLRTGQRWQDPSDLDLQLGLTSVSEVEPGRFRVRFTDGHEADFLAGEILEEAALEPGNHDCPVPQLWDATLAPMPRVAWRDDPQDTLRAAWLTRFLELGFIIFTGVPTEPRTVLKVASTFGFTRDTNFGAFFDVRSTPDASDLAYTSVPLDPHTDNPYRSPVPGVQLLHCLINETTGGLSTLVDGYAAAEALRLQDPDAFGVARAHAGAFPLSGYGHRARCQCVADRAGWHGPSAGGQLQSAPGFRPAAAACGSRGLLSRPPGIRPAVALAPVRDPISARCREI